MQLSQLKNVIEAALFTAGHPVSEAALKKGVLAGLNVTMDDINAALNALQQDYQHRGVQLVKVASGYRFQANSQLAPYLQKQFNERPVKFSRAFLETLALIAYKQPITRGEIEQIRGVSVASHIIKTMVERGWIEEVGHKEVPGRPALLATTPLFLDYFSIDSLDALPALPEAGLGQLEALLNDPEVQELSE